MSEETEAIENDKPVSTWQEKKPEEKTEETPSEGENQDEKPDDKGEKSEEGKTEKKSRRRNRTERHIRNLTREKQQALEESAYLRGQLEAQNKGQQPTAPEKPNADNFDSYDDYIEALTDWKLDQRQAKEAQDRKEAPKPVPEISQQYDEFSSKGVEAYGDEFTAAINDPSLPVTQAMSEVMFDSEHGPDLLMYLSDNPTEAARIANLSNAGQVRELDKLASQVSDYSAQEESLPARKISQAPPPITPERGGDAPVKKNLDEVSDMDEWMRLREATKKTQ